MIITPPRYTPAPADYPISHSRIAAPNNWVTGTVTASDTDSDYAADGPDTMETFDRWKPATAPATWEIAFDSQEVDYCAIAAHTLGSDGVTFDVQYWDGAAWQDVISQATADSDDTLMCLFDRVTTTKMRVQIDTICELGVVRFGKAMVMPVPVWHDVDPFQHNREVQFSTVNSATGEILGTTKRRVGTSGSYSWSHLAKSWCDETWAAFQKAAEGKAVFIAWRPDLQSKVQYGTVTGFNPVSQMGVRAYMSAGFDLAGYAHE